ncbi:MAG: hydrogenase maturation protease [Actinomycetota bacterium]
MTACVIGVGNELRGDDAVGLAVVRLLEGAEAALRTCEGEPVAMLDLWEGFERVVLVDAMHSGAEPGTIRTIDVGEERLPPELSRASSHLLGVADAVELARTIDRLPPQLTIYAIEGVRYDTGTGLSETAATAAASVAAEIRRSL